MDGSDSTNNGYSRYCGFALGIALALSACGGNANNAGSVAYTGPTTLAGVNAMNAAALAGGAFNVGDAGSALSAAGVAAADAAAARERSVKAASVLKRAMDRIDAQSSTGATGAMVSKGLIQYGTVAGYFSYSISVDDTISFEQRFSDLGQSDDHRRRRQQRLTHRA